MYTKGNRMLLVGLVAFMIIALACCFRYGKLVKSSYVNDIEFDDLLAADTPDVMYYHYPFDRDYDIYGDGNNIKTYRDLERQADVIVSGTLNDSTHEIFVECILSGFDVVECYKGKLKKGDTINIFEPVNCTGLEGYLLCAEGYAPMIKGNKYLMYLKRNKNSRFGEGDYVYTMISIKYGKYTVSDSKLHFFSKDELSDEVTSPYEDIKGYDVYLNDEKDYLNYVKYRAEAVRIGKTDDRDE